MTPQTAPDSMLAHPPPICTTWSHYRPPIKWRAELISLSWLATGVHCSYLLLPCCTSPCSGCILLCALAVVDSRVPARLPPTCAVDPLSCEACMDAVTKVPAPSPALDCPDSSRDFGTTRYCTLDPVDISPFHQLVWDYSTTMAKPRSPSPTCEQIYIKIQRRPVRRAHVYSIWTRTTYAPDDRLPNRLDVRVSYLHLQRAPSTPPQSTRARHLTHLPARAHGSNPFVCTRAGPWPIVLHATLV